MKKNKLEITLSSAKETMAFGKKVGNFLKAGDVVALQGALGAGKTTWVKGVCQGLKVPVSTEVASPTFVVIHEYQGREKVFHLDWYRLKKVEGADRDFAQECFSSKAVTFVEWPERGRGCLPLQTIWFSFGHVSPNTRKLKISPGRKTRLELVEAIRRSL